MVDRISRRTAIGELFVLLFTPALLSTITMLAEKRKQKLLPENAPGIYTGEIKTGEIRIGVDAAGIGYCTIVQCRISPDGRELTWEKVFECRDGDLFLKGGVICE